MIRQSTINEFLTRKLDDYDWIKGESKETLLEALEEITPRPDLGPSPWIHQIACFLLIEALHRFILFVDMGGGKTFTCLSVIRHMKAKGHSKAIVFVPFVTAVDTWIEENNTHTPDLRCVPLYGTKEENFNKLTTEEADFFVISYPSAVAMLSEPNPKGGWMMNREFVKDVFNGFDTLIMDEIHKCKSIHTLTYRMCQIISERCKVAVGLTGTPFGRDLQDLWPQFNLVDHGETLGTTMGIYRQAFFNENINYWGARTYKVKAKLLPLLKKVLRNRSIRYSIDELVDMPQQSRIPINLRPHDGIKAYADKAKEIINKVEDRRAVSSEYLRLRQLASGFMTLHGADTTKVQVAFDENPKLDALQDLVEQMPYGCKMVVFHHFVYTNEIISKRLKEMKVNHARIYGKTKDPIAELKRFRDDSTCRVLVLNGRSGSSSLNLQIANYCVFFEQLDSAIDRQQAERRVWRPGQTKRVLFYDLLMTGTADVTIRNGNEEGRDTLQLLLDGKVKL